MCTLIKNFPGTKSPVFKPKVLYKVVCRGDTKTVFHPICQSGMQYQVGRLSTDNVSEKVDIRHRAPFIGWESIGGSDPVARVPVDKEVYGGAMHFCLTLRDARAFRKIVLLSRHNLAILQVEPRSTVAYGVVTGNHPQVDHKMPQAICRSVKVLKEIPTCRKPKR